MKRVDAERGALLCAAHFVADYENLLPSVSGKYAADYDTTIDGEAVTLSCTCIRSDKQITVYPFNEHDGARATHVERELRYLRLSGLLD